MCCLKEKHGTRLARDEHGRSDHHRAGEGACGPQKAHEVALVAQADAIAHPATCARWRIGRTQTDTENDGQRARNITLAAA